MNVMKKPRISLVLNLFWAVIMGLIATTEVGHAGGTVVAWGDNIDGQTTVPSGLSNVVAIAAGGEHSLALTADGRVVAWGYNSYGQTTVPRGRRKITFTFKTSHLR